MLFDVLPIFYIFHNIRYFAVEQGAKLINGICSNTFTLFDCVICWTGKAPLCKLIRTDFFLFHGLEQWFVTNHIHTSYLDYMGMLGNWTCTKIQTYHSPDRGSSSTYSMMSDTEQFSKWHNWFTVLVLILFPFWIE